MFSCAPIKQFFAKVPKETALDAQELTVPAKKKKKQKQLVPVTREEKSTQTETMEPENNLQVKCSAQCDACPHRKQYFGPSIAVHGNINLNMIITEEALERMKKKVENSMNSNPMPDIEEMAIKPKQRSTETIVTESMLLVCEHLSQELGVQCKMNNIQCEQTIS